MSIVNVFFGRMQSMRYVFADGSEAAFIAGRYTTDDADKIAALNYEVSKGHPHIFIDPEMVQVDSVDLDPMEVIKKKVIADYLAGLEAGKSKTSTSVPQALKPSSSANLVDVKSAEEIASK